MNIWITEEKQERRLLINPISLEMTLTIVLMVEM